MKIKGKRLKTTILEGINDDRYTFAVTADFILERLQRSIEDNRDYELYDVLRKTILCSMHELMPTITELMKGIDTTGEILDPAIVPRLGHLAGDYINLGEGS